MKIFLVLACALALATAKSRRNRYRHQDSQPMASDYGEQVAYSGNPQYLGHGYAYGAAKLPVSGLVGHAAHGHGGGLIHYDGGGIGHAQALVDNLYHGGADGLGGGLALAGGPGPLELAPEISKSVFVFSAPPDPSEINAPRTIISRIPITRPQKHYQVVFINAPTPVPPPQHKLELPPHPELKTLVYVLVKKPEKPKPIKVIKPLPRPPTKPEVYFIRYHGKHGHGPGGLYGNDIHHHNIPHGHHVEVPHSHHHVELPHAHHHVEVNHGHHHIEVPHGHHHEGAPHAHHHKEVTHVHKEVDVHPHHQDGSSHYGPPGGSLGEPLGPDYVDEGYASSERRSKSIRPVETDAGVSGI